MHTDLTVSTYVTVRQDCPMRYQLTPDGEVEFSFGGLRDGFHFAYEPDALRRLVRLGTEALNKLGAGAETGPDERVLVTTAP